MIGSHSSGSLSSQFIKLASGDTFVDTSTDLLRHQDWVTVVNAKAIAKLLQSSSDLVEVDSLLPPISLHHIHFCFFQDFNQTGFGHRKKQENERLLIQGDGGETRGFLFKKKILGFLPSSPLRLIQVLFWNLNLGAKLQVSRFKEMLWRVILLELARLGGVVGPRNYLSFTIPILIFGFGSLQNKMFLLFFFIKDIFFEIVKNKIFESYKYFIFYQINLIQKKKK